MRRKRTFLRPSEIPKKKIEREKRKEKKKKKKRKKEKKGGKKYRKKKERNHLLPFRSCQEEEFRAIYLDTLKMHFCLFLLKEKKKTLKGTQRQDASWPENVHNVQILSFADFLYNSNNNT